MTDGIQATDGMEQDAANLAWLEGHDEFTIGVNQASRDWASRRQCRTANAGCSKELRLKHEPTTHNPLRMLLDPRSAVRASKRQKGCADMPMTFTEWMRRVDLTILHRTGLRALDLPDMPYRDWFDDGVNYTAAASRAIRFAKGGKG